MYTGNTITVVSLLPTTLVPWSVTPVIFTLVETQLLFKCSNPNIAFVHVFLEQSEGPVELVSVDFFTEKVALLRGGNSIHRQTSQK